MLSLLSNDNADINNSYTHFPPLSSLPIMSSLQLIVWFFFHPSAWQNYVAQFDPYLRPNFCLAELTQRQWRSQWLQKLLIIGCVTPGIFLISLSLLLWISDVSSAGILFGTIAGLIVGIMFGLTISLSTGIVITIFASGTLGYLFGQFDFLAIDLIMGVSLGVIFGLLGGIAGHIADNTSQQRLSLSFTRQIGGVIFGIFISVIIIATAIGIIIFGFNLIGLKDKIGGAAATAVGSGVGLGMIFTAAIWRNTRQWKRGITYGLLSGLIFGTLIALVLNWLLNQQIGGLNFLLSFGTSTVVIFTALFILPYTLTQPLAGPEAGTITGALASSGGHLAFWIVSTLYPPWLNSLVSLTIVVLALTMSRWRSVLIYPSYFAWNRLLLYLEQKHPQGSPAFLRWHTAFWDELDWIPQKKLDHHLILVAERNPLEGKAALDFLATSRQRWAARNAQIELEARRLEKCKDIEAISAVHPNLVTGELTGPVNWMLHTFRRCSQDTLAALKQVAFHNQRLVLNSVIQRLAKFQQELDISDNSYATRFRAIAKQWSQIITNYEVELTTSIEQSQEIANTYIFSVPLTEQHKTFVGRTNIVLTIEHFLGQPEISLLVMYGQRRMGKTSLLRNLRRLFPSSVVALYIDGERVSGASSYSDFLYNLAREIVKSANSIGLNLPRLSYETLAAEPLIQFHRWLNKIEEHLRNAGYQKILFSLDEAETLLDLLSKGRLDESDLLDTLHPLGRQKPHFKLLLVGSWISDEWPSWINQLGDIQTTKLSYLNKSEAYQLIERPVEGFPLHYKPEASRYVYELTRGHPHLLQLLCHEIVALKNNQVADQRRLAQVSDVEIAIEKALNHGSLFFADIEHNQVDDSTRALLRWLAVQGSEVAIKPEEFIAHWDTSSELDQILASLIHRDLIELTDQGYRFQVELIRRWFAM